MTSLRTNTNKIKNKTRDKTRKKTAGLKQCKLISIT